ncbi:ubiquitin-like-conjugating enzyme ATG10-like, partial [Trifolium medium]|nr:ubiquitin-like-conjugating enzyme ATG10-like [Trifolium medium]
MLLNVDSRIAGFPVDGQPLPLSEIEKDLPGYSAELLLESKWTFITQE